MSNDNLSPLDVHEIRNVALVGGTGHLGSIILRALLQSERFNVTVISRREHADLPPTVKSTVIDYNDQDTLSKAFEGQDAVVCALSRDATLLQLPLINAAVASGVKRFIPAEFGANLQDPRTRGLPNYTNKVDVENYLEEKLKTRGITFTYIYNNVLMDWSLAGGMLVNLKDARVPLFDGGEWPVSMITMPAVAQAVIGVLIRSVETKNRAVYVHEALISQKSLLEYAKEAIPEQEWQEEHINLKEQERQAREPGRSSGAKMSLFHTTAAQGGFTKGFGNQFGEADNELLQVQPLSATEIKAMLVRYYTKARHGIAS